MENAVAVAQLKGFMERAERLAQDKAEVEQAIKDLQAEVKSAGYDVKTFLDVQKRRAKDQGQLAEGEALLRLYDQACR